MQDLSYHSGDPVFHFGDLSFSIQLYTFENVYALDPAYCTLQEEEEQAHLTCRRLTWAGGQESVDAEVRACVTREETTTDDGASRVQYQVSLTARHDKVIRCVKLVLKGLPVGPLLTMREREETVIPEDGIVLHYPEGWRNISTPLAILKTSSSTAADYYYFRSSDQRVRPKKFVFLPRGEQMDVELIYENLASEPANALTVPSWEIGRGVTLPALFEEQATRAEQAYQLVPWEQRADVPAWARDIALVATVHCQHWSGYVFNDYDQVLQRLHWMARDIDPRRILLYLPGWEGRYYWQYGDYHTDERMGGDAGLRRLIAGAHELGAHIMLMFGINFANVASENFEQWGAPAALLTAGGYPASGSVDWDGSRHYDHGWGRILNPAAPTWQHRLSSQINSLLDTYGFDGVFLDISAMWANDPRYNTYDGIRDLVRKIQKGHPDVLIAGEGWYDAMGAVTPLMQAGHTDGVHHWHDQPHADFFNRYNRQFAHLCLGDPGRGSTGVHELGYNPIQRAPLREGVLPTICVVEDTFEVAPEQSRAILADANEYAHRYLSALPTNLQPSPINQ